MAARSFQITLAAAAKRLSDVYADGASVVNAANDIPYRQIILSAETAIAYVGSASTVTSSIYGTRVEIGATAVEPVSIGPFDTGPVKLSDFWAAGASSVLHILAIPF